MLWASSSISFSQSAICASKCPKRFSSETNWFRICSSLSKILMAYHLSSLCWTISEIDSSICATACSTLPINTCNGSFVSFDNAAAMALSIKFSIPSPFNALISTTTHPKALLIFFKSISSFCFLTTSIIFKATTTGIPSSVSCVVKYKFLSMLVASTILIIASGFSSNKYFLAIISSGE